MRGRCGRLSCLACLTYLTPSRPPCPSPRANWMMQEWATRDRETAGRSADALQDGSGIPTLPCLVLFTYLGASCLCLGLRADTSLLACWHDGRRAAVSCLTARHELIIGWAPANDIVRAARNLPAISSHAASRTLRLMFSAARSADPDRPGIVCSAWRHTSVLRAGCLPFLVFVKCTSGGTFDQVMTTSCHDFATHGQTPERIEGKSQLVPMHPSAHRPSS